MKFVELIEDFRRDIKSANSEKEMTSLLTKFTSKLHIVVKEFSEIKEALDESYEHLNKRISDFNDEVYRFNAEQRRIAEDWNRKENSRIIQWNATIQDIKIRAERDAKDAVRLLIDEAKREADIIIREAHDSVPSNSGVTVSYSDEYIESEVQRRVDRILVEMGVRDK